MSYVQGADATGVSADVPAPALSGLSGPRRPSAPGEAASRPGGWKLQVAALALSALLPACAVYALSAEIRVAWVDLARSISSSSWLGFVLELLAADWPAALVFTGSFVVLLIFTLQDSSLNGIRFIRRLGGSWVSALLGWWLKISACLHAATGIGAAWLAVQLIENNEIDPPALALLSGVALGCWLVAPLAFVAGDARLRRKNSQQAAP